MTDFVQLGEDKLSQKQLRKQEVSWILYDCGNSAYSMAITTALYPIFFGMIRTGQTMDLGYFNSIASIIIALISPILGTIADYKDRKKRFFLFFAGLGIISTALLAVLPHSLWMVSVAFFILSYVGFAGANIFYDAFLTDTTTVEHYDQVSAKGFAYGYIASIVPFALSLGLIYFIGMDQLIGYQIGFMITALWWGLFTIPLIRSVKQRFYIEPVKNPVRQSFSRLASTFKEIKKHRVAFIFLISYFFYIDGVDTIIKMVVPYAESILGKGSMDMFVLLGILLIVQIVAFPFALLYGHLAKKYSALLMIRIAIVTYIVSTIYGWQIQGITDIFILGALIGSAQGGIQALSRSYFARNIPKEKANEFFGFYNIFGKFAAIIGPFIMAMITTLTNQPRLSILGIIPLFILGFIGTLFLPAKEK